MGFASVEGGSPEIMTSSVAVAQDTTIINIVPSNIILFSSSVVCKRLIGLCHTQIMSEHGLRLA